MADDEANPDFDTPAGAETEAARKALEEARLAFESAKEAAPELARQARERLSEGIGAFADAAPQAAAHTVEAPLAQAQAYLAEQARERPITTLMTAVGAGFFLGVLMTGRRR
jgi:ElaB/YqjD/DUF883 family membrane-anchored ribosome-binding protein